MNALTRARAEELLARLERHSSASAKKRQSFRLGAGADGTTLRIVRGLSKALPRPDQELADALWLTGRYGARLLAVLLANPSAMPNKQLNAWAKEADSQDLCDFCAAELFAKTKTPFLLAERCIRQEAQFTRRAGFMLLSALASPRLKTPQDQLIKMLPLIKNGAADTRPAVYKAVNKALCSIGKKNASLAKKALGCAQEILELFDQNPTAQWVAKNTVHVLGPATKTTSVKKTSGGR